MMETAKEHNRNVYMGFKDYKKAFYCVYNYRLWVILKEIVIVYLIVVLRKLYTKQLTTIITEFGETDISYIL